MTAVTNVAAATVPVAPARARRVRQVPLTAAGRLMRPELHRNSMLWVLPLFAALFWVSTYRPAMENPPLWNVRASMIQTHAVLFFAPLLTGQLALNHNATYAQIWPLNLQGPFPADSVGVFYSYLPDLAIAQVMFLAGLAAVALGALGLPAASGGRPLRWAARSVPARLAGYPHSRAARRPDHLERDTVTAAWESSPGPVGLDMEGTR